MEYIEHGDLQKYLSRPLPESEARQITGQVLEGLHFMHDNGFVHRDLKPGVR
jgi:calcium/calmodulin-dependent protein kinase I